MSGYKDDLLVKKLASIDERLNQEDDAVGTEENTPEDTFYSLDETLQATDTIEHAHYDPATFVWASGIATTATTNAWGARRFVVL